MAHWRSENLFTPQGDASRPFVICLPPPNVTGSLHLGHAFTVAIQDCVVRWKRMQGFNTLWVPGCDHAGIATQSVVEKLLLREGIRRQDLGREKFLAKVWDWKAKYAGQIIEQLMRMGASLDHTREVFTMDAPRSRAVTEAFVRLYEQGLIFRANRLVNWSSFLQTAVSDLEVDYEEFPAAKKIRVPGYDGMVEVGVMMHFKYKVKNCDKFIEVATTRLETMLGDVAVAVHPEDSRYLELVGQFLEHPFVSGRQLRIIADPGVDMGLGTGAVKITPAHDPKDFEMGVRHQLEQINVLTEDGKIVDLCDDSWLAGVHRYEARRLVEARLRELGLFVKVDRTYATPEKPFKLGKCSRSGDIIEPIIKPQWWMNCRQLAERAKAAVESEELKIIPASQTHTWHRWLDNVGDWCVSRQIWWGHQIPAWKVRVPGQADEWVVARNEAEARAKISHENYELVQDEDCLDTWFSSGLFPFSVFEWPEETSDLNQFFPGHLLETGSDILFFWVARMVMMSLALTDKLPFKEVYLHSMIRDSHGKKMSKSLGNVIDPVEIMEGISLEALHAKLDASFLAPAEVVRSKKAQKKEFPQGIPECGSDALRFGLLAYTIQGRSVNLEVNKIVGYRHFCNKVWQATRFMFQYFPADEAGQILPIGPLNLDTDALLFQDQWILSRLNTCANQVQAGMEKYMFAQCTTALYGFFKDDLCDVYIEMSKFRLKDDQQADLGIRVLFYVLDRILRLLHPFLPFLTEELYQRLPERSGSLVMAEYPVGTEVCPYESTQEDMKWVLNVLRIIRKTLAQQKIKRSHEKPAILRLSTPGYQDVMAHMGETLRQLTGLGRLQVNGDEPTHPISTDIDETTQFVVEGWSEGEAP